MAASDPVRIVDEEGQPFGTVGNPINTSAGGGGGTTITGPLGRQTEAAGVSATLSTQDKAALDLIDTGLDAANAVLGTTADAAVSTDANGSISAKLRGIIVNLVALLARLPTTLGQKTMANSLAVAIASDQSIVPADIVGTGTYSDASAVDAKNANGAAGNTEVLGVALLGYNEDNAQFPRLRAGLGSAVGALTSAQAQKVLNAIPIGQYNATPPTLADTNFDALEMDVNGNLKSREQYQPVYEDNTAGVARVLQSPVSSAGYAPSAYKEPGSAAAAFIKAAAGNVYAIRVTNINAAARYFQLHNKATIPLAGETAQLSFLVPAGTATAPAVLELDSSWFSPSERFATGIGFAWSTTDTTYTAATAGDHTTMVRYV